MTGGVVCYVERQSGGIGIRKLRLVAAGLSRTWTAPDTNAVGTAGSGASLHASRAGAEWIVETLAGVGLKRLAAICVDSEGSICAWLSAPSPDTKMIQSTITGAMIEQDGSGAGVGAARLLSMSDGNASSAASFSDTSVQALATIEAEPAPKRSLLSSRKADPFSGQRHRYAVLAIPDAAIRVLLDELDRRGIETDRVMSVWHAMAQAWDASPAARSGDDPLVASTALPAATIIVEPTGKLIWAWTRAGELVAGGSMRLAQFHKPAASPSVAEPGLPPAPAGDELVAPDAARRVAPGPESDDDDDAPSIEFTSSDSGRLAMDWLAWSAQLGHCPQRVVCLSAPNLQADGRGPQGLVALLSRAWPGATIDGAIHQDPVSATIARVAGLGSDADPTFAPAARDVSPIPIGARPRQALVGLSSRPGRADRWLFVSIGGALCAAAMLVGAVGYQVGRSTSAAEAQLEDVRAAWTKALDDSKVYDANIMVARNKEESLENALTRMRDQMKSVKPARPILPELIRLLDAMATIAPTPSGDDESAPRASIAEIDMGLAAVARLAVPDAETGPTVLERLMKSPGALNWQGNAGGSGTTRNYTLMATWPENLPAVAPAPAPTPTPAPAPAPAPTPAPPADAKPESTKS